MQRAGAHLNRNGGFARGLVARSDTKALRNLERGDYSNVSDTLT
jgi:hypothetical protein